ncbi:MAG TPA: hypothetical protein VFV78_13420 [Vicinamibacterales bacterium]|nr:hypothetical protein [Vicinamibacterales bacterium]
MSTPPQPSPESASWIPGIYNHCDGWCERCRFTDRCRVFHDGRVMELMHGDGPVSESAMQEVVARRDREEAEDAAAGEPPAEFLAFVAEANREPTPAEVAEFERDHKARRRWTKEQPAYQAAREYGFPAADVALAWQEMPGIAGESVARAGLASILHFAYMIPVKTARALHGLYDRTHGDDDEFSMDDANGTAKLLRLAIAESRQGWIGLIGFDHEGTGLPMGFANRLTELDAQIATLFPDAMDFHRPGLDD